MDVDYEKNKHLIFQRLWNDKNKGTKLIDVDSNSMNPPTEIEDCLNPEVYYQTLLEFAHEDTALAKLIKANSPVENPLNSYTLFDLRESEKETIKAFFDNNEGFNKIKFARKYVELMQKPFFSNIKPLPWVEEIRKQIN
ncbi:hypothetical protein [Pontibacter sp. BAB1700]|uniref:hypothetical protein n=1 Tax=Pontibacter sp. BAB1700 TaxID=1144253 RepID=UPI000590FBA4|nr:hypothetical protein [Pontibacter sp. BAB1700]